MEGGRGWRKLDGWGGGCGPVVFLQMGLQEAHFSLQVLL